MGEMLNFNHWTNTVGQARLQYALLRAKVITSGISEEAAKREVRSHLPRSLGLVPGQEIKLQQLRSSISRFANGALGDGSSFVNQDQLLLTLGQALADPGQTTLGSFVESVCFCLNGPLMVFPEHGWGTNGTLADAFWLLGYNHRSSRVDTQGLDFRNIPTPIFADVLRQDPHFLARCRFSHPHLSDRNLEGQNLAEMDASGATFDRSRLFQTNLSRAKLSQATFYGSFLAEANLARSELAEARFGDGTTLRRAILTDANLTEAILGSIDLTEAVLSRAVLTKALLGKADLTKAVLVNAILDEAHLSEAILVGAVLTGSTLKKAKLEKADLRDADLRGCDLRGASLADADLRGVQWKGARLGDTNLSGAKYVRSELSAAQRRGILQI